MSGSSPEWKTRSPASACSSNSETNTSSIAAFSRLQPCGSSSSDVQLRWRSGRASKAPSTIASCQRSASCLTIVQLNPTRNEYGSRGQVSSSKIASSAAR